jgi:hypothetical protein
MEKVIIWLITFIWTYLLEVVLFAVGWAILGMAWTQLPDLGLQQLALTVLGLKLCKFSFTAWYHSK